MNFYQNSEKQIVCMGNGGEAAKQSADAVCNSVEAGGLAKAFADFGLLA